MDMQVRIEYTQKRIAEWRAKIMELDTLKDYVDERLAYLQQCIADAQCEIERLTTKEFPNSK